MFKISKQTYDAFEEDARREFRSRLVQALRKVFSAETRQTDNSQLAQLADIAIDRAQQYELDLEYSTWAMFAAMFVFGHDFDTSAKQQWSRDVLLDQSLAEDAIIGLLGLRIYMTTGKTI